MRGAFIIAKREIASRFGSPVAYVVLTKAGRQRVADARDLLEGAAAKLFRDRWADKEIATLASLLGRFTAALPAAGPRRNTASMIANA